MKSIEIKEQNRSAVKKRSFKQLNLSERVTIENKYQDGWSFRKIARYLGSGRSPSSISREIADQPRKGVGRYQAYLAQSDALDKRKDKKFIRLKNDRIQNYIIEKLKLRKRF
mgnify:CR=1 FL=1